MNNYETLIVERRGAVEWITMNRPDRLNALTPTMANELADSFAALQNDLSARIVVLRGAGRAFCAGLDIKASVEGATSPRPERGTGIDRLSEIVLGMRSCPQPVIALVHGAACGGGFAFALAADIRIAAKSARMNDAIVTLGASGCEFGISYFLPKLVGPSVAAELMYTGSFIDAQRALQVGLVSRIVEDGDLDSSADELISAMLRVAPLALRKTKATLARAIDMHDLAQVIDLEARTQQECLEGPDFAEGLRAFVEKREPHFKELDRVDHGMLQRSAVQKLISSSTLNPPAGASGRFGRFATRPTGASSTCPGEWLNRPVFPSISHQPL